MAHFSPRTRNHPQRNSSLRFVLALAAAHLLLCLVSSPAVAQVRNAVLPAPIEPPSQPAPAILKGDRYLLQRGDQITIRVLDLPELNETVTIGPDGRISLVLISEMEAAGITVEELRRKLTTRYAEYYIDPQVGITVKSFANLKVFVGGEVERPGLVPLNGDLSAAGAVLQCGGFKTTARKDSVVLIRNDGRNLPTAFRLNLKTALDNDGSGVYLQPFDVVYVPVSKIARIDQFVDQYIRRLLPATLTGGFEYLMGNTATLRLP